MQSPAARCVSLHLWDFLVCTATSPAPDIVSMIQSQIGEIAITFPSTLAPAYVFRFGVTRRHSVSIPRIPAKWTITTSSQLSAVLDVQRTCQINGLELSVFWRFSIEQERRPPWSGRGSEHVVFLLRRGGWTAMRSKLRTAPANVSGGSPWLHTGNFCKATRQISLYLSSWVSLPDAHHQHGPISTRTSAIYSPPAASRRTESVSISQIDTSIPQQTIVVSRLVCDQSHKCYNSSLKRPDQHQNRWRQDIDIEPYRCNNAGVWFCGGFSSRSSTRSSSQDGGLHSNPKVEMIITEMGEHHRPISRSPNHPNKHPGRFQRLTPHSPCLSDRKEICSHFTRAYDQDDAHD